MSFIYISPKLLFQLVYQSSEQLPLKIAAKNAPFNLASYAFMPSPNQVYEKLFVKKDFQDLIKTEDTELIDHYWSLALRRFKSPNPQLQTKPHIILLNVDSLSDQFMNHKSDKNISYLPYFDKLAQKGLYFTNFYFHWQCSFNSFVSLLLGFPMLDGDDFFNSKEITIDDLIMNPNITKSMKQASRISLMDLLKTLGYKSFFIQGSEFRLYSMESFLTDYGVDQVIGANKFLDIDKNTNKNDSSQ